jgi:hypothetical protein
MIAQGLTVYSIFFLATALISFFIAFLSWQRKSVNGARELTYLMIAAGIGAFCLIFETAARTEAQKIFWSKLEYIGGITTPVFYLTFVLRYTGKIKFLSIRYIALLFTIPLITYLLTLTNEKHNLIWTGFSAISEKTNLMEYYHGLWFWIGYIAYTYILLLFAAILLLYFIIRQTRTFRSQGWVIFSAGMLPWIASVLYLLENNPVPGLDLPPISIVLSGSLAAYAILNYRFLDLVPVARETLMETLPDGILALDGQNRIQDINEAAMKYLGIKDKNIIGSEADKIGAAAVQLLKAVVNQENNGDIEIIDGNEIKTFNITKKEIKKQKGSRLIVIHDITARRHDQEALIESELKYRMLVESSPDAITIYVDGKIVFVNNECLRLMAASGAEELIGKPVMQFVHPDSRALVAERMKSAAIEGNILPLMEEKFVRPDGSAVDVEVKAMPIRFGKKLAVQLIVRDITERKLAQEEIAEKEEKYRGLSEASFEAIFLSEDGICMEQNQSAEKMFGYTPSEAVGRFGTEWLIPEDREMVLRNMLSGYEEPYEATALRKDGTTFPCMLHGKMMRFRGKAVRVTSLTDITVRKQFEKELIEAKNKAEESDRLKSAFLANMSHEIRTPMNSILGFTDLLKTHNLSGEKQKEYIQIINKGGDRLLNIINDIIDISKIESGHIEVNNSKVGINEQLDYIASLFKPETEEKGIKVLLRKILTDEQAEIWTDKEKLIAILTNLVKNAIKFTVQGYIEIGYKPKENQIEFYVKDTGAGIDTIHQEIIFHRFRQGNESLSRNYEGTGLGLSISKAYAELLGGRIWVKSKPGEGSVFYFTIPYITQKKSLMEKENTVPEKSDGTHTQKLKVLIVENDESSRILLSRAISKYKKTEFTATDGIEAVGICRSNPDIDLILMDIRMPVMDGYEATRRIREFNKEVIIIAQTAFALTGDKDRALQAGCNDYISKPILSEKLHALIEKYFNSL